MTTLPFRFDLYTPVNDNRPVYVTGDFCDWLPDLEPLQLQPLGGGHYVLNVPDQLFLPDQFAYKYTRGGWEHVELDYDGEPVANRMAIRAAGCASDVVPHWRWFGHAYNADFLPTVVRVSQEFEWPQLATNRPIHVLLPYDYEQTEADVNPKRYPVLYLHDGQNLFGEGVGFGSWEVDHKMAILAARHHHDVILVSIDHGDSERIREFTLERTRAGRGKGRHYLNFIAETLKPYINANFRTLPDPANTGIGGSSLGGLISLYGGLMFPEVFGKLLVFSPSLWISPKIYFDAIRFQAHQPVKVYVYGGEAESVYMVPNLQRFKDALLKQQYGAPIDLHLSVDPEGLHQEAHWSREFPKAVEWLFYG